MGFLYLLRGSRSSDFANQMATGHRKPSPGGVNFSVSLLKCIGQAMLGDNLEIADSPLAIYGCASEV